MPLVYGQQHNKITMKQKLSFATTITTVVLFAILTSVKIPFLFISAFILLLTKGIKMYIDFTNDNVEINEENPKENLTKLLLFRLGMQIVAIAFVAICMYIFFLKQDIWKQLF